MTFKKRDVPRVSHSVVKERISEDRQYITHTMTEKVICGRLCIRIERGEYKEAKSSAIEDGSERYHNRNISFLIEKLK